MESQNIPICPVCSVRVTINHDAYDMYGKHGAYYYHFDCMMLKFGSKSNHMKDILYNYTVIRGGNSNRPPTPHESSYIANLGNDANVTEINSLREAVKEMILIHQQKNRIMSGVQSSIDNPENPYAITRTQEEMNQSSISNSLKRITNSRWYKDKSSIVANMMANILFLQDTENGINLTTSDKNIFDSDTELGALLEHRVTSYTIVSKYGKNIRDFERCGYQLGIILSHGYNAIDLVVFGANSHDLLVLEFNAELWRVYMNLMDPTTLHIAFGIDLPYVFYNLCDMSMDRFIRIGLTPEQMLELNGGLQSKEMSVFIQLHSFGVRGNILPLFDFKALDWKNLGLKQPNDFRLLEIPANSLIEILGLNSEDEFISTFEMSPNEIANEWLNEGSEYPQDLYLQSEEEYIQATQTYPLL